MLINPGLGADAATSNSRFSKENLINYLLYTFSSWLEEAQYQRLIDEGSCFKICRFLQKQIPVVLVAEPSLPISEKKPPDPSATPALSKILISECQSERTHSVSKI